MSAPRSGSLPFVKLTVAVITWGASFVLTKIVLVQVSPVTVVWLRFTMGLGVLGVAAVARKELQRVSIRDLGYFAVLGFLGVWVQQWLQANGLVTAKATTTAWIVTTSPVFIALLGRLVLGERLGLARWAGIALAALGVLLVVGRGERAPVFSGAAWTRGDLLILASAPNWAVFSVLSRRGLSSHPAVRMMLYVMAAGWLFVSVWFAADRGWTDIPRLDRTGWIAMLALGILSSGLAYIFWYDGLQALPAARAGIFLYIEPLVTAAIAPMALKEAFTLSAAFGGAAILFGVWMVNRNPRNEGAG